MGYIDAYRKQLDFAEIVPVSAKKGNNVDTLLFTYGKSKFMVTGKELKHGFLH